MSEGQSPDTIAQRLLALQRFTIVTFGLVIWETLINLNYDWRLVRRQPWPWPPATWTYLVSRFSVLTFVVLVGIHPDADCAVTLRVTYVPPYLVITSSSLLIAFRTMAVWSFDVRIVTIVLAGWLLEFGLALFTIIDVAPLRVSETTSGWTVVHCENESTWRIVFNLAVTFVYNTVLLVLALIMLWRQRRASAHGLTSTLWNQGLVWLCCSSAVMLPTLIVVAIDRDELVSNAILISADLFLYICATRMFRQLHSYDNIPSADYETELHLTTVNVTSHSSEDAEPPPPSSSLANRQSTHALVLDCSANTTSVSVTSPSDHSLS